MRKTTGRFRSTHRLTLQLRFLWDAVICNFIGETHPLFLFARANFISLRTLCYCQEAADS